jgi:hypothetical protein
VSFTIISIPGGITTYYLALAARPNSRAATIGWLFVEPDVDVVGVSHGRGLLGLPTRPAGLSCGTGRQRWPRAGRQHRGFTGWFNLMIQTGRS